MSFIRRDVNDKSSKHVLNIIFAVVFSLVWSSIAHSAHLENIDLQSKDVDCSVCYVTKYTPKIKLSVEPTNSILVFIDQRYQSIPTFEKQYLLNIPLRGPPSQHSNH